MSTLPTYHSNRRKHSTASLRVDIPRSSAAKTCRRSEQSPASAQLSPLDAASRHFLLAPLTMAFTDAFPITMLMQSQLRIQTKTRLLFFSKALLVVGRKRKNGRQWRQHTKSLERWREEHLKHDLLNCRDLQRYKNNTVYGTTSFLGTD
jgi:hypothetical protein